MSHAATETGDESLDVLLIEDSADDAALIERELERAGFEARTRRVETAEEVRSALADDVWDVALSDHVLPDVDSTRVLELRTSLAPDLPLILVSGAIGEEAAVAALRLGAADYVNKDHLERLGPAVRHGLREIEARRARRAAEAALAESEARHLQALTRHSVELERANAQLKELTYAASHDLSEPLRTISGFVQLLADRYRGRLDSDADEFIDFVVDGTERMRHLIDDLLMYSRFGSRPLELEDVDCVGVLARVELDLQGAIAEADASIEVGELPSVTADPDQLERLFVNLISNAIKFRGSEPPRVQVFAESDGPNWRFSVVDNGIGIEPRHAERVFNVFQSLHAPGEYTGTGVGLSICKRIVERHGGRIWVEQAKGGGSAIRFTIPGSEEDGP